MGVEFFYSWSLKLEILKNDIELIGNAKAIYYN